MVFLILEGDQIFLSAYIYPLIYNYSLVHDSYLCKQFGGSPFPVKREGNCFVGSMHSCNKTALFYDCPLECRPKNHSNWRSC